MSGTAGSDHIPIDIRSGCELLDQVDLGFVLLTKDWRVDYLNASARDRKPGNLGRRQRQRRMIERILTQFEDIGADNLDFLLSKLQERVEAEAASAA